jgi:uncharacterized protein YjbI with pentapeptide repeats
VFAGLSDRVAQFLRGEVDTLPSEIGDHDGRRDLRGFSFPDPSIAAKSLVVGLGVSSLSVLQEVRGVRWDSLDLSHARLNAIRLFDSSIVASKLDGASCVDWRLWGCNIDETSFVASNMREAVIGAWHAGKRNVWRGVDFSGANLRGALARGCVLESCLFVGTQLRQVEFDQAAIRNCRFAGPMQSVVFDGRALDGRPAPHPLKDVDFSSAAFRDVEFYGCHFENVKLPQGVSFVPALPAIARRGLAALAEDESIDARIMKGDLENVIHMRPAEDSVGVYNRADYVASGGESLADLAESIYLQ